MQLLEQRPIGVVKDHAEATMPARRRVSGLLGAASMRPDSVRREEGIASAEPVAAGLQPADSRAAMGGRLQTCRHGYDEAAACGLAAVWHMAVSARCITSSRLRSSRWVDSDHA